MTLLEQLCEIAGLQYLQQQHPPKSTKATNIYPGSIYIYIKQPKIPTHKSCARSKDVYIKGLKLVKAPLCPRTWIQSFGVVTAFVTAVCPRSPALFAARMSHPALPLASFFWVPGTTSLVEGVYYETLSEAEMVMEKESQNSKLANQMLPATQKWIKLTSGLSV